MTSAPASAAPRSRTRARQCALFDRLPCSRSIRQPLFDRELRLGEAIRDPNTRLPVAIQQIALRLAALDVRCDGAGNLLSIVADVNDVVAAFTSYLSCADIDSRHAEVRTLTNRHTRIPHNRR